MSDNDYILPDWESIDTPESRVPEVPFAYNNMPDQGDIYVDPENPESMGFFSGCSYYGSRLCSWYRSRSSWR